MGYLESVAEYGYLVNLYIICSTLCHENSDFYQAISSDLRNANLSISQRSSLFTSVTRQPNTKLEISQETFVDAKAGIQIPTGPVG